MMTTMMVPAQRTEDGGTEFSFELTTPEEISISNLLLRRNLDEQEVKMNALAKKIEDLILKQPDVVPARIRRIEAARQNLHETLRSRK